MEQQEAAFDLARRRYEAGLIPEVEALQPEVDLARSRNQHLQAEGTLSRTEDLFKLTVGLPLHQQVSTRTDLEVRSFVVDEAKAIAHALAHRTEIRQREINRRLAEITLKEVDARSAIRGNLTAYFDLTGVSDPSLGTGAGTGDLFRSSFSDLQERPRNRGVQFSLSVPLWDSGVNKAEVQAARARLQQSVLNTEEETRRVTLQIKAVNIRLRETQGRLGVLQQSEEVAERTYAISMARFDNGDITSADLALDRDRLTQARQDYLDAYIAYQLAVADLKRQTLYDWENDRSLVREN